MGNNISSAALFEKFKTGDKTALDSLVKPEGEALYDYVMRMTGQINRSLDTFAEVRHALGANEMEFATMQDLRVSLYAMGRSFNADIWNANTESLTNAALHEEDGKKANFSTDKTQNALMSFDTALAELPPWEREPIILVLRHGFSFGQAATIMSLNERSIESSYREGMGRLKAKTASDLVILGDTVESCVKRLPRHPLPPRSSHQTMDLSIMIRDLKISRFYWRRLSTWVMIGSFLIAVLVFFFLLRS